MTECTFVGHVALGDLILLCPIGVYLTRTFDKVYFPGRLSDRSSLETFFINHPRVEWYWPDLKPGLYPFHYPASGHTILSGIYKYPEPLPVNNGISFIENYYAQAGIPMSVRWDYCPLQEASMSVDQHAVPTYPFEFIHDAPERGYCIRGEFQNPFFVRDQPRNLSILRYVELLRHAREIHCIDSCFLHLTETVATSGILFYHKYARPLSHRFNDRDVPTRKEWKVLQ